MATNAGLVWPQSQSSLDQVNDTRVWTADAFAWHQMTFAEQDRPSVYDVRAARYNVEGRRTAQQVRIADELLAGLTVTTGEETEPPHHAQAPGNYQPTAYSGSHHPSLHPQLLPESDWAGASAWAPSVVSTTDPRLPPLVPTDTWSPASDFYPTPGLAMSPEGQGQQGVPGSRAWSSTASSVASMSTAPGYPSPEMWARMSELEQAAWGMNGGAVTYGVGEAVAPRPPGYWRGTYPEPSLPTPPSPPPRLQQHSVHSDTTSNVEPIVHSAYGYPTQQPSSSAYWATESPHFPEWVPPQLDTPGISPSPYEQVLPYDDALVSASRTRHHSQGSYLDPYPQPRTSQQPTDNATYPEIVDFTASNGVLAGSLQASPSPHASAPRRRTVTINAGNQGDGPRVPKAKVKRTVIESDMACIKCGKPVAKLLLRGTADELAVPHTPIYSCTTCSSSAFVHSASNSPSTSDSIASDGNASAGSSRVKQVVNRPAAPFRKRSRRADDPSALLTCDVCLRDVASGGVVANDSQSSADFAIEAICVRCLERYRRCSDCGGGGGNRIAVGKWRSKELFSANRKTCDLSHLRLGSLSDTYFDVWAAKDLPVGELDAVVSNCKRIFTNTMMAAICIPEVLETQTAMATSWDDCRIMGERGWLQMEPMIREDIEPTREIRRYLALRFCTPHPRKTKSKVVEKPAPIHDPTKVMREGKDLMGFIIAEHDLVNGTMFLAVVAPWAMADLNDPAAVLIQSLLRRADAERISTNLQRARIGLTAYPPIVHVWTMLFFKRDSRMMNHMERTRGFSPLDEYMDAFSNVNPLAFPPHRPCYIPLNRMHGWQVLVRSQTGDGSDDWYPRRAMADRAKKANKVSRDKHRG